MSQKITIKDINEPLIWNKFINFFGKWNLFQSYLWGQLQINLKIPTYRLGIFDGKKLVGIAQVFLIRAKRGWFFQIRQGPVFIETSNDYLLKYWKYLIDYLKSINKSGKCSFIRVNPMILPTHENYELLFDLGFIKAPIHAMDAEICWVLDLVPSEDELLKGMRKTTRYLIRKAEKIGVKIYESNNINDFLSLYETTAKRHGFVKHQGIKQEYNFFKNENKAKLFVAKHENKILASALILFHENQAIYHHGASISTSIPASYLLQWHAIKYAQKNNKKIYNFWGIAPQDKKNHPWKGITLFKQGFGGREVHFVHALDLPLSPFYGISYTIETVRRIYKGY